jgi:hypothetical protein
MNQWDQSERGSEAARLRPRQRGNGHRKQRPDDRIELLGVGLGGQAEMRPSVSALCTVGGRGRGGNRACQNPGTGYLLPLGLLRNWQGIDARESERAGAARKEEEWAQTGPPRSQDKGRLQAAEAAARARRLGGAPAKSDGIEERPLDACASPASATGQRDAVAGRDTRARRERWENGRATASSRQREGEMRYCVWHLGRPGQAQYPDRHNIRRDANCWSAWFHWDNTNRELIRSVLVRRLQMRIA